MRRDFWGHPLTVGLRDLWYTPNRFRDRFQAVKRDLTLLLSLLGIGLAIRSPRKSKETDMVINQPTSLVFELNVQRVRPPLSFFLTIIFQPTLIVSFVFSDPPFLFFVRSLCCALFLFLGVRTSFP